MENSSVMLGGGQIDIMGYHQKGDTLPMKTAKHGENIVFRFLIKIPGGLICQNNLRLIDKCPGNGNTSLLASGQLGRINVGLFCQPNFRQQGQGVLFSVFCPCPEIQGQKQIFQSGEGGDKAGKLENKTDGLIAQQ